MNIPNKQIRLSKFYGDVAKAQNADIMSLITGRTILDIGCGYGNLINQIRNARKGTEVTGIDIDTESIRIAKDMYGINVKPISVYKMDFADNSFDTVILREAIHHFETEDSLKKALSEIRRVCGKELIIFDPNPNWIVRLARKLIRHRDPEAPMDVIIRQLEVGGFKVREFKWRDVVAFPLSGGFVGRELIPNIILFKRIVIVLDNWLNRIFLKLNIQKHVCWRYLIYATKERE